MADRWWCATSRGLLWKYNLTNMERSMEIEAGFTAAQLVHGDDRVRAGVLPAGRYAVLWHVGHPRTLINATVRLLQWADQIYHDKPGQDINEWETELAFRLAD